MQRGVVVMMVMVMVFGNQAAVDLGRALRDDGVGGCRGTGVAAGRENMCVRVDVRVCACVRVCVYACAVNSTGESRVVEGRAGQ